MMKIQSLSFNNNIFIVRTSSQRFYRALTYSDETVAKLSYVMDKSAIRFNAKLFCAEKPLTDEVFQLFSQMVYFIGEKKKDVVYDSADYDLHKFGFVQCGNTQTKAVGLFADERAEKVNSIDELYKSPWLVPWNLVGIEWDVLNLVKKDFSEEKAVLEVGSGFGKNMIALNRLGYSNVKGIENSVTAHALSQKVDYCKRNNFIGDIVMLPFEDGKFDCVVDIGCLHCADEVNRKSGLREIWRVLKVGGEFISRFFLPQNQEWIAGYPVKVGAFGETVNKMTVWFNKYFEPKKVFRRGDCMYYIGVKYGE